MSGQRWLTEEITSEAFFLLNFIIVQSNREKKHGVVMLALFNLNLEVLETTFLVEHVAAEITYGRTTFLLCCIDNSPKGSPYIIPLQNIFAFNDFFHCKALEDNQLVVLTGDLNMNHTDWAVMSSEGDYENPIVEKLAHHGLNQILE